MYIYLLIALLVWNLVLSLGLWLIYKSFNKLAKDVPEGNLIKVLQNLLSKEGQNAQQIEGVSKRLDSYIEESKINIKKVGLVRFNPFNELGGDHSFTLSMLDGVNTGFILTGLHTREKTRIYIKKVKEGKSEIDLSKEEKKALEIALKVK